MEFESQLVSFVQTYLKEVKKRLEENGVSHQIIEKSFNFGESQPVRTDEEEPSTPLPTKRMLVKNTAPIIKSEPTNTNTNTSTTEYVVRDKYPQDYSNGEVVLVMNYSGKSHALFGEFGTIYSTFKNEYLLKNPGLYSYNQRLVFGGGWILKVKSKLDVLKSELRHYSIKYKLVEMDEYLKNVNTPIEKSETVEPEPLCKEKPKSSNTKTSVTCEKIIDTGISNEEYNKSKLLENKIRKASSKKQIRKNRWGNYEDDGLVIAKLPVGKGGKKIPIVIGIQDPEPEENLVGFDTVYPLDQGLIDECTDKHYNCLTEKIILIAKKYDPKLSIKLQKIWDRIEEADETQDETDETNESSNNSE